MNNTSLAPAASQPLTLALADRITDLRFDTLPAALVDAAATGVLDTIGVTLAGAAEPCDHHVPGSPRSWLTRTRRW